MNCIRRNTGACLIVLGALAGCSSTAPRFTISDATGLSKIQPSSLAIIPLGGPDCTDKDPTCTVTIELVTDTSSGTKYCLVRAPLVTVDRGGSGNDRKVVWKLAQDKLDGKPVSFATSSGILVVKQAPPPPKGQHVQQGGIGDGTDPNLTNHYWMKVNRGFSKGATSTYLPIVLWGEGDSQELCAATDPKIVNA